MLTLVAFSFATHLFFSQTAFCSTLCLHSYRGHLKSLIAPCLFRVCSAISLDFIVIASTPQAEQRPSYFCAKTQSLSCWQESLFTNGGELLLALSFALFSGFFKRSHAKE